MSSFVFRGITYNYHDIKEASTILQGLVFSEKDLQEVIIVDTLTNSFNLYNEIGAFCNINVKDFAKVGKYKAYLKHQRSSYVAIFNNPFARDSKGVLGRRARKGLGCDKQSALLDLAELNKLLAGGSLLECESPRALYMFKSTKGFDNELYKSYQSHKSNM